MHAWVACMHTCKLVIMSAAYRSSHASRGMHFSQTVHGGKVAPGGIVEQPPGFRRNTGGAPTAAASPFRLYALCSFANPARLVNALIATGSCTREYISMRHEEPVCAGPSSKKHSESETIEWPKHITTQGKKIWTGGKHRQHTRRTRADANCTTPQDPKLLLEGP